MSRKFLSLGALCPRGLPDGSSELRVECLIEGGDPEIEVTVLFAQPIERQVLDASNRPVAELTVTGRRYTTATETVERDVRLATLPNRTAAIRTAGSERVELSENGVLAGSLIWRWQPLHGTVEAWIEDVGPGLHRAIVAVANRLEWERATHEQNLMRVLRSIRVVMECHRGAFRLPRRRTISAA